MSTWLSIGETARRAGVSVRTLRFYEDQGLLRSVRSEGGHATTRPTGCAGCSRLWC